MRKHAEFWFDGVYLLFMLGSGCFLLLLSGSRIGLLFGIMGVLLGAGDLFHLAPRMIMLRCGRHLPKAEGLGKWMTSVTSTVYYLLLYHALMVVHPAGYCGWAFALYLLAGLRILLCCLPCNDWLGNGAGHGYTVLRNVPFALMGAVLVWVSRGVCEPQLRFVTVAVFLSFLFYLLVVLFAARCPAVGMLMMPKAMCYVWLQVMGMMAADLLPR